MRDGSMFHDLRYYTDKQYYEAHQKISLQTLYENTLWEIFSFYDTDVDFIYNKTSFANPVEFSALLAQMKSKSIYDTGVDVTVDDQVLTLSTCTNTSENMRYVVHAKRIQ
jgi:sortase B